MSVARSRRRSAAIIVSSAVLALAFASSQSSTAQAQTVASNGCPYWVNSSGKRVPSWPPGSKPTGDPNYRTNPSTGEAFGVNASGQWVNSTGQPVPYWPPGSKPTGDPNYRTNPSTGEAFGVNASGQWVNSTGQPVPYWPPGSKPTGDPNYRTNPSTGEAFELVPCPPPTQTAGLQPGGHPVLVPGGNVGGGWSRSSYSDFPTFDGSGAGGGVYGAARFYVQPNFFVGPEAGFMLLDINARNQDTAFGFIRTDAYLGGQAGVTVQGPGASKINLYTGLDAHWSRITVGVEAADERMSKILGGWSVHSGVELQPIPSIPTLWLGVDVRPM